MRAYHYLEARWALDDIRRRRLKLSKIDDMNDPYEFNCVRSDDKRTQWALEETGKEVVERFGVQCFSRSWNEILMWSHYADKHRGICLGFDVPDDITRPVEYVDDMQTVGDLLETTSGYSVRGGISIVDRLCGAKYEGWSYEEEIRVHGSREEVDEETGYYFVKFDEHLVLKEVIAGVRFPFSRKVIEDALRGYPEDVRIVKAGCSPTTFAVIVDEDGFDRSRREEG